MSGQSFILQPAGQTANLSRLLPGLPLKTSLKGGEDKQKPVPLSGRSGAMGQDQTPCCWLRQWPPKPLRL